MPSFTAPAGSSARIHSLRGRMVELRPGHVLLRRHDDAAPTVADLVHGQFVGGGVRRPGSSSRRSFSRSRSCSAPERGGRHLRRRQHPRPRARRGGSAGRHYEQGVPPERRRGVGVAAVVRVGARRRGRANAVIAAAATITAAVVTAVVVVVVVVAVVAVGEGRALRAVIAAVRLAAAAVALLTTAAPPPATPHFPRFPHFPPPPPPPPPLWWPPWLLQAAAQQRVGKRVVQQGVVVEDADEPGGGAAAATRGSGARERVAARPVQAVKRCCTVHGATRGARGRVHDKNPKTSFSPEVPK